MNINLIYKDKKYQFDTSSQVTIEYIKDLTYKITRKTSNIDLYYKNDNLMKYNDKKLLKEIIKDGETNITINIQKHNQKNHISKASTSISNSNYNNNIILNDNEQYFQQLKNRFLQFHNNYLIIYDEVKSFDEILEERFTRFTKLSKEFKKYSKIYEEKLAKFYDDSIYKYLFKKFNNNLDSRNLSEREINSLGDKMELCLNNFKYLKTQCNYQKNIIHYLQFKIEDFLKLKILIHQLNEKEDFESIITHLDIIFNELSKNHNYNPIDLTSEIHNLLKRKPINIDYNINSNFLLYKNSNQKNIKKNYNFSDIPPLINSNNNIVNNDTIKIKNLQIKTHNKEPLKIPNIKFNNYQSLNFDLKKIKVKKLLNDYDNPVIFDYRIHQSLSNDLKNNENFTNESKSISPNQKRKDNVNNTKRNNYVSKSLRSVDDDIIIINNENEINNNFINDSNFSVKRIKKKRRTKRNKSKVQDNNFNEENKEENNLTYNQSLNKLNSSKDFNEKKILTKLNSNNTVKVYNTIEVINSDDTNKKSRNNALINKSNSIKKELENKRKFSDYKEIEKKKIQNILKGDFESETKSKEKLKNKNEFNPDSKVKIEKKLSIKEKEDMSLNKSVEINKRESSFRSVKIKNIKTEDEENLKLINIPRKSKNKENKTLIVKKMDILEELNHYDENKSFESFKGKTHEISKEHIEKLSKDLSMNNNKNKSKNNNNVHLNNSMILKNKNSPFKEINDNEKNNKRKNKNKEKEKDNNNNNNINNINDNINKNNNEINNNNNESVNENKDGINNENENDNLINEKKKKKKKGLNFFDFII